MLQPLKKRVLQVGGRVLKGEKLKKKKHRALWTKLARAIEAKGVENFKVQKIKSHQDKKAKEKEIV